MIKKPKVMILIILFSASLVFNLYLGINSYMKSTYAPNLDDQQILGEMTKMVLENEQYQEIASKETVYAIKQGVSRFNVADPASIFHYEIHVQTEKESYIFTCVDENCTNVSNEGWTYSRYSEHKPILPIDKES
ncbi:hypothetical protein [Metabacillus endolithicus]|uniref:DUF3139 domain-containing protein n=1 Tax=Metabacillus endolithicus TaxID=1535204 RepID=A0ABW5BRU4_9BACI|nr:hypothetical protein [Metabacillus endolithicus]UPG63816.1 hypothetical protein MVE64_01200 [Metabacillus endolithicus]